MTITSVFPNAMWDLRYWLRNHPNLNPLHGGRVFFRLPDHPVAPFMRLYRVGGAVQSDSEVPMQDLRLSIEIWGMQDSDFQKLTQLQLGLEDACTNNPSGTLVNPSGNTILDNAGFTTGFDSPDPDTGWPRIVCDVTVTVKASTPTIIG